MRRTQIYLSEEQYDVLRSRAKRSGKTLAGVIREILDAHLAGRGIPKKDPFDEVIGSASGDGESVAENVDEYLYGKKP